MIIVKWSVKKCWLYPVPGLEQAISQLLPSSRLSSPAGGRREQIQNKKNRKKETDDLAYKRKCIILMEQWDQRQESLKMLSNFCQIDSLNVWAILKI